MVFSSFVFVLAFLPAVLVIYYSLSRLENGIYQRIFLIVASLVFYGYYNVKYLLLIIVSMVINYAVAALIQRAKKSSAKAFLVCGILFNIGLIGYFKYYDFFVENINALFGSSFELKQILLPLGISFFTFQQLSFLVSVYRNEEQVEKLHNYCLFVTFFPQLVAGPIVLYSEMIPQFKDESRRYFQQDNFASGIYMFTTGLFKKAVVADTFALFADAGFAMTNIGFAAGWATALSYTMQIFFDFSGYSDMAIGLGKMFNIDIPINFWQPYRAESITEFWRKWHITLGRALSTYIYKPLGGNRKGLPRTCLNLFLTFMVSGLWHGAAWTFVLWGALHGAFVVVERVANETIKKIPRKLRVIGTFLTVNFLWVLFRAETFGQAVEVYKGMFNLSQLNGIGQLIEATNTAVGSLVGIVVIISAMAMMWLRKSTAAQSDTFIPTNKSMIWSSLFFVTALLCLSRESVFVYFNF